MASSELLVAAALVMVFAMQFFALAMVVSPDKVTAPVLPAESKVLVRGSVAVAAPPASLSEGEKTGCFASVCPAMLRAVEARASALSVHSVE